MCLCMCKWSSGTPGTFWVRRPKGLVLPLGHFGATLLPKIFFRFHICNDPSFHMPYARRLRARPRNGRRRVYRRTRAPAAVRPRKTGVGARKAVIRRNFRTNRKQASQIRTLFRLRYGSMQMNLHQTNVSFSPTQARPCILDLGDFSCFRQVGAVANNGCQIQQVNSTGTGLVNAARWNVSQASNPFWGGVNQDSPDTGKYLIQSGLYRFRMTGIGRLIDTRVKFHLCRQVGGWYAKRGSTPGILDSHQTQLPYCLINMTGLCGGVGNRINTQYIRVLATKTVYFNSDADETTGSTQTTANTKWLNFFVGKQRKPRYQDYTAPTVPGTVEANLPTTDSNWEAGVTQTDVRQGLFLVISASTRYSAPDAGSVSITADRTIKWLDSNGSAAIY